MPVRSLRPPPGRAERGVRVCDCAMYKFASLTLSFAVAVLVCGKIWHTESTKPGSQPIREANTEALLVTSVAENQTPDSFELYSTLPGKMARMEELLNAIDRFLEFPDFQDRLITDAEEFHRLLIESRELYPAELLPKDQPMFDQAITETVVTSEQLLASIRANDDTAAREALDQLDKKRQKAHTRFSN